MTGSKGAVAVVHQPSAQGAGQHRYGGQGLPERMVNQVGMRIHAMQHGQTMLYGRGQTMVSRTGNAGHHNYHGQF